VHVADLVLRPNPAEHLQPSAQLVAPDVGQCIVRRPRPGQVGSHDSGSVDGVGPVLDPDVVVVPGVAPACEVSDRVHVVGSYSSQALVADDPVQ